MKSLLIIHGWKGVNIWIRFPIMHMRRGERFVVHMREGMKSWVVIVNLGDLPMNCMVVLSLKVWSLSGIASFNGTVPDLS